jgi:hypothetical protein
MQSVQIGRPQFEHVTAVGVGGRALGSCGSGGLAEVGQHACEQAGRHPESGSRSHTAVNPSQHHARASAIVPALIRNTRSRP